MIGNVLIPRAAVAVEYFRRRLSGGESHHPGFYFGIQNSFLVCYAPRRRRIKTEEKAKVVAAVWVTEYIQFLAALAVLPTSRTILN